LFPKAQDLHKPNKPLVPNGLGVIYVLASVSYLFILYYFQPASSISSTLTLAVCVLFGGFMGLLDDWMDLRWRYKAFFPLIAAIPLIALATSLGLRTHMVIPFVGIVDFGSSYYYVIIPLIVTITTNTVNQLGGLNGLETICPAIVMVGLMISAWLLAIPLYSLLYIPLIVWLLLAFFNFQGRIFVGNTGSFAVGMTLAAFAIISDLKTSLLISLLPYIFNSVLILLTYFFFKTKAAASFDGEKLVSDHRRSLITLITHNRPLGERRVVVAISLLVAASTSFALLIQRLLM
jgi:UDP-N-acetylglucosamine--dolichyl-phosphate N-acetylglucosaminephosphotransferase